MRPRAVRSHTVQGRFGVYLVPNIPTVDARLRALLALLPTVSLVGQARIYDDLDLLLDRRLLLMREGKV